MAACELGFYKESSKKTLFTLVWPQCKTQRSCLFINSVEDVVKSHMKCLDKLIDHGADIGQVDNNQHDTLCYCLTEGPEPEDMLKCLNLCLDLDAKEVIWTVFSVET